MVWVTDARLEDGYKVFLKFNDGVSGVIDLYNTLQQDKRQPIRDLLDMQVWKTMKPDLDTICWSNGVDFAPEYLYDKISNQRT
jgi:hypothetical protein